MGPLVERSSVVVGAAVVLSEWGAFVFGRWGSGVGSRRRGVRPWLFR
jgi:hypothetical protein